MNHDFQQTPLVHLLCEADFGKAVWYCWKVWCIFKPQGENAAKNWIQTRNSKQHSTAFLTKKKALKLTANARTWKLVFFALPLDSFFWECYFWRNFWERRTTTTSQRSKLEENSGKQQVLNLSSAWCWRYQISSWPQTRVFGPQKVA